MKKNRAGFTLVEILITIIIMVAIAGLAVPSYFKTMEEARSNEAKTNLNIMHMGEKLAFLANGVYWGPGATTIAAANTGLNTDMSATYYTTISITQPTGTSYRARLTRNLVGGGNGVSWYQYDYTNGDAAPVLTNG